MDAPDSRKNPQSLVKKQMELDRSATLPVATEENGGFTVILKSK
jgi:hypothetical protein